MQDRVTYEYAIIRVVPKVERGEFINVGVILYSKFKRYLGIKYLIDSERLTAFSPDIDLEILEHYLNAWEAVCIGKPDSGPIGQLDKASRFRWITASKSTILQCSRPHPGLCHQPEEVMVYLFEFYVL